MARPYSISNDTDNPRLPIGPFREWLLRQEAIYGSTKMVAAVLDMGEKQVYTMTRRPGTHVTLDVVDRAGCAHGEPQLLRELYPETYDLPDWLDSDEVAA